MGSVYSPLGLPSQGVIMSGVATYQFLGPHTQTGRKGKGPSLKL